MPALAIPLVALPPTRVNPQMMLLYGPPKVGKTAAIAALPECLLLELEPKGADFVTARKMAIPDYPTFVATILELQRLKAAGTPAARRLAIDTVDWLEDWADPAALADYKRTPLGSNFTGTSIIELPQGAGYGLLRKKVDDLLWQCSLAADEVILLGHVRDRYITKAGGEVAAQDLDLMGKVRNLVCSQCSAIGFMSRPAEGTLRVSFKTSETVNCGSRCEHLRGREFTLGRVVDGKPVFDWDQIYLPDQVVAAPATPQPPTPAKP